MKSFHSKKIHDRFKFKELLKKSNVRNIAFSYNYISSDTIDLFKNILQIDFERIDLIIHMELNAEIFNILLKNRCLQDLIICQFHFLLEDEFIDNFCNYIRYNKLKYLYYRLSHPKVLPIMNQKLISKVEAAMEFNTTLTMLDIWLPGPYKIMTSKITKYLERNEEFKPNDLRNKPIFNFKDKTLKFSFL